MSLSHLLDRGLNQLAGELEVDQKANPVSSWARLRAQLEFAGKLAEARAAEQPRWGQLVQDALAAARRGLARG